MLGELRDPHEHQGNDGHRACASQSGSNPAALRPANRRTGEEPETDAAAAILEETKEVVDRLA